MRVFIKDNEGLTKIMADLTKLGYDNREAVMAGLRLLHKKEYPPYITKKGKKELDQAMTLEEIAEDVLGGKIEEENGVKYVYWKEEGSNFTSKAPLSAIKDFVK